MCICLYMCECRNPQGPEESIRVPRTGVTGGCDCCACWESNFGPLEGQPFSLITESPLIDFSTFIECHLSQALPVYLWCIHGWQRDKILFLMDFLGLIKKEYNAVSHSVCKKVEVPPSDSLSKTPLRLFSFLCQFLAFCGLAVLLWLSTLYPCWWSMCPNCLLDHITRTSVNISTYSTVNWQLLESSLAQPLFFFWSMSTSLMMVDTDCQFYSL